MSISLKNPTQHRYIKLNISKKIKIFAKCSIFVTYTLLNVELNIRNLYNFKFSCY
jgi:hypothetical protein